jgi:hypothetical protein
MIPAHQVAGIETLGRVRLSTESVLASELRTDVPNAGQIPEG